MKPNILIEIQSTLKSVINGSFGSKEDIYNCIRQESNLKQNLMFVSISVVTGILLYIAGSFSSFSLMYLLLVNIISAFLFYFVLSFSLFVWTKNRENIAYNIDMSQKILAQGSLIVAVGNIIAFLLLFVGWGLSSLVSLASFALYLFFICKIFSEITTSSVWGIFARIIAVAICYGIVISIIISSVGLNSVLVDTNRSTFMNEETIFEDIMSEQMEKQKEIFLKQAEKDGEMSPEEIQYMLDFYDGIGNLNQEDIEKQLDAFDELFGGNNTN